MSSVRFQDSLPMEVVEITDLKTELNELIKNIIWHGICSSKQLALMTQGIPSISMVYIPVNWKPIWNPKSLQS